PRAYFAGAAPAQSRHPQSDPCALDSLGVAATARIDRTALASLHCESIAPDPPTGSSHPELDPPAVDPKTERTILSPQPDTHAHRLSGRTADPAPTAK